MLSQLVELALATLSRVSQTLGIIQAVQAVLGLTATEDTAGTILVVVNQEHDLLTDPTTGLLAIQDTVNTILTDLTTGITAIEAAIALVQQTGVAVTLPSTPPAGYGGLDATDTGNAVWDTYSPSWAIPYSQAVDEMYGTNDYDYRRIGKPYWWTSFFASVSGTSYSSNPLTRLNSVVLDLSIVGPTDTLLDALEGQNPDWLWTLASPGDHYYGVSTAGITDTVACLLNEFQFDLLKGGTSPGTSALVPPVWPGIDNVTLGTPVAIDVGVSVDTPMDGVIVEIDAVAPNTSFFNFNGFPSYRYLGAIAFYDNDGEEEAPQNLGFQFQVYCPKSMVRAGGFDFRSKPGTSGTITPWLITEA